MTGLIGQAAYEEVDLVFREVLKVQKLTLLDMGGGSGSPPLKSVQNAQF